MSEKALGMFADLKAKTEGDPLPNRVPCKACYQPMVERLATMAPDEERHFCIDCEQRFAKGSSAKA